MPELVFQGFGKDLTKKYTLKNKLGSGGFANVWAVEEKSTKKVFACKVLKKKTGQNFNKLKKEVKILKKLRHENICPFIEGFETPKKVYLVMGKCDGGDVYDFLCSKKVLKESDVKNIMKQTLQALVFMHKNEIFHSDLKPENLMFMQENRSSKSQIQIIDFGLSHIRKRLVWIKQVGGTPMYMPPEVLQHRLSDSMDLWAVGVMTFEQLFGYLPFDSAKGAIATIKVAAKGFKPTEKPGKGPWFPKGVTVSEEAKDFIGSLLKTDPSERPTAAEALLHPWLTKDTKDYTLEVQILQHAAKRKANLAMKAFAKKLAQSAHLHGWVLKDIQELFKQYDTNNNGEISWDEFRKGLVTLAEDAPNLSEEEIHQTFDDMDTDGNHVIDIDEFLSTYAYEHVISQDDRLWKMISDVDKNCDGKLTQDEIRGYLEARDMKMKPEEMTAIQELFTEYGSKGIPILEAIKLLI